MSHWRWCSVALRCSAAPSVRPTSSSRLSTTAIILIAVLVGTACAPEPEPTPALPSPPELPDLTQLDPPVREQFEQQHQILTQVLENQRADDRHRANAYGELGRIYHAYSQHAVAVELYRAAHQLEPQEALWPHLLGLAERQQGRWQAAAEAFQSALELKPGDLALLVYLGENAISLHQLDQAEQYFNAALERDPSSLRTQLGLGRIALDRGQLDAAIEWLEAAHAETNSSEVRYSLAMAYRQAGRLDKAEELLTRVDTSHLTRRSLALVDPVSAKLQELRRDANYFEHRALKAIARKDWRRAVNDLRQTVAIAPDRKEARFNLALALLRLNQRQEAEAHLRQALETDPNFLPALRTLTRLLQQSSRADEAAPLLHRVETLKAQQIQLEQTQPTQTPSSTTPGNDP